MKNNATRTIRSEEITIDVRICATLAANRGGEVYLAAIAPDMELTVITLDDREGFVRKGKGKNESGMVIGRTVSRI